MSDSIKFGGITLDCPHVGELAAFTLRSPAARSLCLVITGP
jgi:hypothetical protein